MPFHTVTLSENSTVRDIVKQAVPGYRKKTVWVSVRARVEISGTYWNGGSKDTYSWVTLHDDHRFMLTFPEPSYDPPQFGGPKEPPTYQMQPLRLCLCYGTFNGKPSTLKIYCHESDLKPLLEDATL